MTLDLQAKILNLSSKFHRKMIRELIKHRHGKGRSSSTAVGNVMARLNEGHQSR